jgi:hypothetical protein
VSNGRSGALFFGSDSAQEWRNRFCSVDDRPFWTAGQSESFGALTASQAPCAVVFSQE